MKELKLYRHSTEYKGLMKWVDTDAIPENISLAGNMTLENLQKAIDSIPGTRVISIEKNSTGVFYAPMAEGVAAIPEIAKSFIYHNIPEYYCVIAEHDTGDYTETITMWFPLKWNGRFFGTGGGGSKLGHIYGMSGNSLRYVGLVTATQNGFAAAATDGGNVYYETCGEAWPYDAEKGDLRWELIENWHHRSTHNMTVIGKKLTEAAYGEKIMYSYFMGSSGGGRQALMEAYKHPDDYNGIFSCAPAINWFNFVLGELWPAVVVNEYNNPLSRVKLDAFKEAVWEKYGGKEKYFSYSVIKRPEYDASVLIGKETADGVITETDAMVMQTIWDGPVDEDGNKIWFGVRPGSETWGEALPAGILDTVEKNGKLEPVACVIPAISIPGWIKDPEFDWKKLTTKSFGEVYRKLMEFAGKYNCDDVDLSQFRDDGGKMILVHGLDDELINPEGTFKMYCDNVKKMGKDKLEGCLRFYPLPGDGHSMYYKNGCGLSLSSGMIALTEWVEKGIIPGNLTGQHLCKEDMKTVDKVAPVPFLSLNSEDLH